MTTILKHLSKRGHTHIAYLSGDGNLDYSKARVSSFRLFARQHGLDSTDVEFTDFDPDRAADMTRRLSGGPNPFTAFIYENEILAAASLRSLIQAGGEGTPLPAIVSFEDSFICQSTCPTITSVHRDAGLYGTKVANLLLKIFQGAVVSGNRRILTPRLVIRESTASVVPEPVKVPLQV